MFRKNIFANIVDLQNRWKIILTKLTGFTVENSSTSKVWRRNEGLGVKSIGHIEAGFFIIQSEMLLCV